MVPAWHLTLLSAFLDPAARVGQVAPERRIERQPHRSVLERSCLFPSPSPRVQFLPSASPFLPSLLSSIRSFQPSFVVQDHHHHHQPWDWESESPLHPLCSCTSSLHLLLLLAAHHLTSTTLNLAAWLQAALPGDHSQARLVAPAPFELQDVARGKQEQGPVPLAASRLQCLREPLQQLSTCPRWTDWPLELPDSHTTSPGQWRQEAPGTVSIIAIGLARIVREGRPSGRALHWFSPSRTATLALPVSRRRRTARLVSGYTAAFSNHRAALIPCPQTKLAPNPRSRA